MIIKSVPNINVDIVCTVNNTVVFVAANAIFLATFSELLVCLPSFILFNVFLNGITDAVINPIATAKSSI